MNYLNLYTDFLDKHLNPKRPMKIVADCSNGTTGLVLEKLFAGKQKCETILLNKKPDGNFPAHGPNPLAEGALNELKKAVIESKADLGVIYDADGDRAFFVDNLGRELPTDIPVILISRKIGGSVALTIDVGLLARRVLAEDKKMVYDSRVGHYFIKQLIRSEKISFAAERSGHYYFADFSYLDSGIFATIQIINAVSELSGTLSDWADSFPKYFRSGELNFEVEDKEAVMKKIETKYAPIAKNISKIDGIVMNFDNPAGEWRFCLRASNTENLLRLNLESENEKVFERELTAIKLLTR